MRRFLEYLAGSLMLLSTLCECERVAFGTEYLAAVLCVSLALTLCARPFFARPAWSPA